MCEDRIGTGPPRARTEVISVDLEYWAISVLMAGLFRYGPHNVHEEVNSGASNVREEVNSGFNNVREEVNSGAGSRSAPYGWILCIAFSVTGRFLRIEI